MKIVVTKQDVEKLARLSAIELDEAQKEYFAGQLQVIISYCAELEKFSEIEEFDVDRLTNVFREDKVEHSPDRDVVEAFVESKDSFLKIPKFLD